MDKELEEIVFNIIGHAGTARSYCFEALQLAKNKKFEEAYSLINEAKEELLNVHSIQTQMIQAEANGNKQEINLLLMHAEDHLMNAMLAKDLISEIIELYKDNYENRKMMKNE